MTDYSIPRENNRYKRPILYPPDGFKRVPYSRPSTLGKDLDDGKFLVPWEQTMVAIGLAKSRHLFSRVQGILARGGSWSSDKDEFKEIVGLAKNAAGWKDQADRGTSIHDLCDAAEKGILDWDFVPDHLKPVIEAYVEQVIPHFKFLATEVFVAVDEQISLPHHPKPHMLRAAGSIDRIGEFDGERYIIDIKSGRDSEFRTGVCGQLFLYSIGKLYSDEVVKQKEKLGRDWFWMPAIRTETVDDQEVYHTLNPSWRASTRVDTDKAIMLQAPKHAPWKWKIMWVPLAKGREIVECGQWARKARSVPEFKEVDL